MVKWFAQWWENFRMHAFAQWSQKLAGASLATRIGITTSLVLVVGIALAGGGAIHVFRAEALKRAIADHEALTARATQELDEELIKLQRLLRISAQDIRPENLASYDAAQQYLNANSGLFAGFDRTVALFSPEGRLLAERPYRMNRRGRDVSRLPVMQETLQSRQPAISDPFVSSVGDGHVVTLITMPILAEDGQLIGVMTGSLSLTRPESLASVVQVPVGLTGYIEVFTAQGKLVLHPNRKRLGERAYAPGTNPSFERALQGMRGTEDVSENGKSHVLVSYDRSPTAGWIVAAHLPKDEALASIYLLTDTVVMWIAVGCALGLILLWIVARALTRPLAHFTRHLADCTTNETPLPVLGAHAGSGEVRALTQAFDHLTGRLHQREDALIQALQRYQLITEHSKDLITKHTADGTITYASPVSTSLLGLPPAEMMHRSIFEFVHPEDCDAVQAIFEEVRTIAVDRTFVFRARQTNQHYTWLEATLSVMDSLPNQSHTDLLCIARNVSDRKGMEERLYDLARTDQVTGLPNRVLLQERLDSAISCKRGEDSLVAALMIDIDRFKKINDSLGHSSGDALLQLVARRLSACIRDGDTLARWGGDEFVLLLPELKDATLAGDIASRCLSALKRTFKLDGQMVHISASIGVSTSSDGDLSSEAMLKNAHTAVYKAKARGGDCFVTYVSDMNAGAQSRLSMENALFHAIENDQLRLHYQPLVFARTGKLAGVEALLRWQHPDLGLVPPAHFIPMAEDTGLIGELGEWVLRTACKQMATWYDQGLPRIPVSVNLSSRQFRKDNLVSVIKSALEETQLAPELLELELTESLLMDDVAHSQRVLTELKELGVTVALDDFGTGYSSLSYLKRFPLDTLKIDRSFTMELPTSEANASIVCATIGLAKGLGLRTVAEGVETRAQSNFLVEQGCDVLQGYLFSKPMPAEELFTFGTADPTYLVSKKAS